MQELGELSLSISFPFLRERKNGPNFTLDTKKSTFLSSNKITFDLNNFYWQKVCFYPIQKLKKKPLDTFEEN